MQLKYPLERVRAVHSSRVSGSHDSNGVAHKRGSDKQNVTHGRLSFPTGTRNFQALTMQKYLDWSM